MRPRPSSATLCPARATPPDTSSSTCDCSGSSATAVTDGPAKHELAGPVRLNVLDEPAQTRRPDPSGGPSGRPGSRSAILAPVPAHPTSRPCARLRRSSPSSPDERRAAATGPMSAGRRREESRRSTLARAAGSSRSAGRSPGERCGRGRGRCPSQMCCWRLKISTSAQSM